MSTSRNIHFHLLVILKRFTLEEDNANRIKDSGWLKEECDQFIEESIYPLPLNLFLSVGLQCWFGWW
jgi:hypothetical protein